MDIYIYIYIYINVSYVYYVCVIFEINYKYTINKHIYG